MEDYKEMDDFLAKWASGDLSEGEKQAFKRTKDYPLYAAILEGTERLDVPAYEKERLFRRVQQKFKGEQKVIQLVPKWAYAVAASIALLVGYFVFFDGTVDHETGYGEKLAFALPDGSEVILNAKSRLEYKRKGWEAQRTLILEGEAYFKVVKGSKFTVHSNNGIVTVLGTRFSVNTEADIFKVVCYEGKVKVEKEGLEKILSKGQGIRAVGQTFEDCGVVHQEPSWLNNETSFHDAPLKQVIKALEKQYGITINPGNVDTEQRFTGSFTHDDLDTALKSIFESLEITYTFKDGNTIDLVPE